MSIHVSEPGRPVGTRLPEIFRGRRVGNVTELEETQGINISHSDATDGEFQQAAHAGRHRALEEYGAAASGEYREQRPYLPVSNICTPVLVSVPATVLVAEALDVMDERGVSHLVVTADGNVAGLVELRWLLAWLHENQADASETSLVNLELPAFLTASPETDAHQLARLMLAHQLNAALIIGADGQAAGIVTSTDYLRLYADVGRHEGSV
ncbi:CBS domain-containing protein [Marinobacter confluentis]|uniref:CBS domain-containing protein n=1 Tax=Marinobacter confluentis TaxID=1697557 RepID=A0A4Z1CCD7_9GAMM|nr:CBS domain-containing protein [Marinobacter confluentis]TGN41753.1 CBS domain-containing protein [Marinobacter confluentis]